MRGDLFKRRFISSARLYYIIKVNTFLFKLHIKNNLIQE